MALPIVDVTDLYEAAYILTCGNRIEEVRCIPLSEGISCQITLTGETAEYAQTVYATGQAQVNVHAFRRAYGQVNSFIHEAKKNYDRERRRLRNGGGL